MKRFENLVNSDMYQTLLKLLLQLLMFENLVNSDMYQTAAYGL